MVDTHDGDAARRRYLSARERVTGGLGPHSVVDLLTAVCVHVGADLDVTGVAINLMSRDGSDGVIAATDEDVRAVGELQFTTGEGPCHDAFAMRRPVLTPDLHHPSASRWPGYVSAAMERDVAAVFAFPLHIGAVAFGVMDVYAHRPGPLSREQVATALTFAEIATEILLDGGLTTVEGDLAPAVSTALDRRGPVHQAQGMVMVDLAVDVTEALVLMRAHAFAHDIALITLAQKIIGGFVLPRNRLR